MIKIIKRYIRRSTEVVRSFRNLLFLVEHYYKTYHSSEFREIGENCIIHPGVIIYHPNRLVIKNNVQIHSFCVLQCQGGLYIGNNVGMAIGTYIMTANHVYRGDVAVPYGPTLTSEPVRINDNVWIGANVKILPGVELGEGSIVGMGAVVTKDVPPCAIVLGNPARVIGYRDKREYKNSKSSKKFVKHGYWDKIVVPKYIQRKTNLMEVITDYILNDEMFLED